jgi:site-specific DNA recombinase
MIDGAVYTAGAMTPAYALLRRSRSHQDLSITDQRAAVTAWASANGYTIVREFADDGSGLDTARRREFTELLAVCSDKSRRQADVVLCYDVSRFSRLDPDEAAWHEYGLKRAGVRVLYTHEAGVNEDGITGQLVKGLKRALAHDYSQKLSQVVSRGLRSHAALGHWTGGQPPYGYRRAVQTPTGPQLLAAGRWKAKGETVVLIPDPAEAAIVREIYETYVHGDRGLMAIASRLNARAVPVAISSRWQATSRWTKVTLHGLLRNPIYIGRLSYGKSVYSEIVRKRGKRRRPVTEHVVVEQAFEPLIERALWDAAQRKHGVHRKFGDGRAHEAYLLSGLIVCASCGRRFRGHRQIGAARYAVYVCGSYHDSGRSACDGFSIRTDYLEAAVLDGIQKRIDRLDPAQLGARVRTLLGPDERATAEVDALESALGSIRRRITALIETVGEDRPLDLPSFRRVASELERERERLERELVSARARSEARGDVEAIVKQLVGSLARTPKVLAAGAPEDRRAVVRSFLSGIRIEKESRQAVLRWYRLPKIVSDVSLIMVELRGLEPLTPRLPALCSPN